MKNHIGSILFVIALIGLAAFTVKVVIDEHNEDKNSAIAEADRDRIAREFEPRGDVQSDTPPQTTADVRGPEPEVLGSTLNSSPTPTPPVTTKPYRNDTLSFSAIVPYDTQFINNSNEVIAGSPAGTYWTLTAQNTTETLETIETQLRNSTSTTSVTRTTVNGKSALQFTSPNLKGAIGYALITNGRLYYLVGNFNETNQLANFKFF